MLIGNNFRKETITRLHSVLFLTKKKGGEEELICHAIIQRQLNLILKELHASTNEFHGVQTHINTVFLLFFFFAISWFRILFFFSPWKMLFTLTRLAYWVLFLERTTDDKCPINSAISLSKHFDGIQSTGCCYLWGMICEVGFYNDQ